MASLLAGVVLTALVLGAALTARDRLSGAFGLAALGGLWLLTNGPMEGATLVVVIPEHGLTVADLAGLAAIAVAGCRASKVYRRACSTEHR